MAAALVHGGGTLSGTGRGKAYGAEGPVCGIVTSFITALSGFTNAI